MAMALSFILVSDSATPQVADLQREIKSNWPDLKATDFKQEGCTMSYSLGEGSVVFGQMPAPFPWSDLEGPCKTSLLWPKAAAELKKHQTHWIVTVNAELNEMELSALLTRATASFMEVCPTALGVYWGNATLIVPKKIFIDFTKEILPHGPPLHIWVDFRVGKDSENTSAGFTAGMKALGHMEFETQESPEPPAELRERLLSLAGYVLENGPVIKDGDTVGEDADERIRVVYSKSAFGHKGKVMRLEYETASAKKPWWKLW